SKSPTLYVAMLAPGNSLIYGDVKGSMLTKSICKFPWNHEKSQLLSPPGFPISTAPPPSFSLIDIPLPTKNIFEKSELVIVICENTNTGDSNKQSNTFFIKIPELLSLILF